MAISVDVIISGKTATSVEGNTTAAVITTNLLEDKLGTKGGIISGSLLPHQTDTVDLGSPSKRFLNLYTKTAHLDANSLKLGDSATISAGAGGGFSFDTEGTTTFGDLLVRNLTVTGTHSTIETTDLAIKDNIIVINSGEAGAGITLTSGGLVIDRGTLESATILFNDNTDRFEFNFPISVDGSELALVPNLIITGQTLQGQITSNDGDIVTLTTNLASTGSTVAANIITSGQTLTTNLASTGTTVAANLVTSGQTLTTNLASTGTTVAANLVTSGQYLTSEVGTLSGLSVFHSMTGNFATHFHNLDDIYLAGNQGKYLKVNSAGDGLSYDLPPVTGVGGEGGGATHFTGLVDTPNGYSGIGALPEDGGLVVFNSTSEQIAYASSGAFASDADLISSGNTLDSKRDVLSGNLISSGNALDAARDILSGNLISTGNNLENQIISNDGDIATLTSNLVSTGNTLDSQRDTLSGNLISTGNNLEAQITSNDGDISTLQDQKFDKIGGTLSGSMTPDASGTLNLGTRALPFQSGYFDELWVGGNTLQIGDESSISAGPDGFSFDTTGTTTFGDVSITGDLGVSGNFTLGDTTTDKITARGDLYVEDDAFFADAVKITGSLTVDGTASAAAPTLDTHLTTKLYVDTTGDAITTNLASTGNNLQAQITTDIANLISSGAIVDGVSGNLISSGQTLQTQITSNDSDITSLTSNLVTTGQTLTTTTDTISSNLITSGQTLQTQITSNDSDISSITTNLASTGSTLAADIVTVSGLTFGNDSDIATITSNLVSTGQTLTTEINTVSGLITSNDGDITVLQTATGTLKTSVDANTASISSNDSDITTLTSNLVSTGTIVDDISGNLIVSGQTLTNLISAQDVSTVSSNLITTGQSLTTDIGTVSGLITTNDTELNNLRTATGLLNTQVTSNDGDISNLTSNLITSGQNLTDDIATVSGLAAGGELVDALSGNLITTGQTLQSQISSNDSDVSTLTTNLVSTGQSITSEIAIVSGLTTSNDTDIANLTTNLATTGQTLQTQITSNDSDISSFTSNIVTTGQTLQTQITSNDSDISTLDSTTVKLTSNQTIAGNKTFSDTVTITDLNVTGTQTTISATNLAIKDNLIEINSGEVGAGITLVSGGITINRGSADNANILFDDSTDQFELNFPIATEGNLVATAPNLISTGQTLQTQITSNDSDITSLTSNLVTTGQTLQTQVTSNDSDISTLTSNLSTTDSNLITTGQTLQTQITSNDSDISTLTTNLISTGTVADDISGNLITTGQTLQTQITSNDGDITSLTTNLASTGSSLDTKIDTLSGVVTLDSETGNLVDTSMTGNFAVNFLDLDDTPSSIGAVAQSVVVNAAGNALVFSGVTAGEGSSTFLGLSDTPVGFTADRLLAVNSAGNAVEFLQSGSLVTDSETGVFATAANLISTGNNLEGQITSNDSGISTLTTNLITTGQTLQTQITSNDSDVSTLTSNLISTGQTLTTDIGTVSGLITSNDTELGSLRTATGSLQTQVTSNDSDITSLTTNLVTTGQTLQTQITSNDSDISTLTTNLISTGSTLNTKIDTLSGVVALDSETGHLADTTVLESFSQGLNVGTSSNLASRKLHVVGDIEISGTIYQSGSVFEGGGGGGGSSTFLGLSDTPGSFTAGKYLSVNSAGNAVEMVNTIQSGFATIDQGYFTGFDLAGTATGIVQNASGSVVGLDLADNKWDVSIIEETDAYNASGDSNFNSVSLLLHFDGVNGATTFTESSSSTHAITGFNGASLSTTKKKFGDTSLYLNTTAGGSGGDYITVPNSSDFHFGSNDFTIEFWFNPSSIPSSNVAELFGISASNSSDANGSLHIDLTTASKIDFSYWHSSAGNRFSLTSSSSVSTNTWHHIAAVRDGNTIRLFLDGSAVGTTSWSITAYDFAGDVHIGERSYITSYGNVNGYLDDYRITKGVARYTSAFTPHTTAHLDSLLVAVTEAKYIGQIGGWDDADVDYGIKKISNSELSVKKMSSTTPDRAYVNVQKLGAVGQGIAFNQLYTGDGVTTNYLLTDSVPNTQDLLVSVQGLIQTPNIDYTMAGNTGVSFTTGVTSGDEVSLRYLALGPSGATGPTGPAGSAPDLTASGFALNANLAATGAIVDDISGNLITSGQTLQTQITSNDSDISSLTTNLISTGQSITSEIAIVSGLTTSNDTDIATLTTNIGTTGQTLTSEIATVSGLIPATVVDGAGVTGYGARWFDGNTLTTGTLYDDGTKVGIGTNNPSVPLHVAVDGTAEILLERTTGMGGMPSQIKIKSVGSEWSLANNLAGNGKFSIKDVTDNRHVMVFDGEGVVTTNNLEPLNGNDSGYLGSSSKKWKQVYFGILEADTATFSDQIKFYNGSDKCFQIETDSGKDTYINSYGSANFIQFKQNSAAVLSLYETFLAIPDSTQLRFGGGSDLRFYHDGNNSYIWQVGVGALNIKSSVTDGNIVFTADRGDGGGTFDYFSVNGGDTTYAGGVTTAYTKWPDNSRIALGGGKDLQLYHDGSNSHIKNTGSLYIASETSGDLYLRSDDDIFIQPQGGENGITLTGNGAVTLYYDNAVKLATASTGVTVTGLLTSTTATFSTTGETNPIRIESDANCGISLDTTQANGDELVIRNIVNGTTPMFQWRNQDTSTNLMQLDAINVRLGIGTVSPKESLHVRGQTILDNNTTAVASAIPTTVLVTDQSDATIGFAPRAGGTEASAIIGIDDSDSDKFKISYTTTDIGAVSHFTMDSSGKVGIGTVDPNKVLHVVGDIEISGAIYQSGSLFEGGGGGGGGGGSSTFVGLSDTPGSFTANRILSVNSAGNAVETAYNVSTISGHQSVDQGYFTGFSLAGAATGIIQNASGSVAGLNLADNKWDVSIVEESDSQAITGDANWSSVKLLLPVDGTNNATTTTDSSSNAHTVTLSNGAKISTTKSKWGGSSLFLDGTNDYGEVAYDADFDFGNADFTVELWYYPLSQQSDSYIIAVNDNSSQSAWAQAVIEGVSVGSGMKIEGGSYDSGMKWTAYSSEIALNTWHHLAYVRYNNKVYMYVNGTATDSGTTIGSLRNNSTSVLIGRRSHGTYTNAYLDDIRITKGLARYTANFTPPTEALGTVINTVDTKYISQIGGWDDTDVDYGIKKISNSELSIKKMGADDVTRPIDRLYVNVQKLGAIGQGVAFDQLYTGDGSATAFTLPASVPSARDLMVSVEGLVQIPTVDYSVSATTLTFTTGVTSGNLVDARYLALGPSGAAGPSGAGGGGGAVSSATNRFTGNGVISGFEMTRSVSTADEIFVYVNGLFQDSGDNFTITNGTGLYFTNGDIASGDKVIVRHIY